jgi:hypothetical protein
MNDRLDRVRGSERPGRLVLSVLGVAAAGLVVFADFYVALMHVRCGDEGIPEPDPASPRGHYCGLVTELNNTPETVLGALLVYGPTLVILIGATVAVVRRSAQALWRAGAAACLLMALSVLGLWLPA